MGGLKYLGKGAYDEDSCLATVTVLFPSVATETGYPRASRAFTRVSISNIALSMLPLPTATSKEAFARDLTIPVSSAAMLLRVLTVCSTNGWGD